LTVEKRIQRLRRAKRTRMHIRKLAVPRLSVHRSGQHLYAQVFSADNMKVLATASTVQGDVRKGIDGGTKNKAAAAVVGRMIAERALAAGIDSVAFDRSGFLYHGRVQALADAAREAGLKF